MTSQGAVFKGKPRYDQLLQVASQDLIKFSDGFVDVVMGIVMRSRPIVIALNHSIGVHGKACAPFLASPYDPKFNNIRETSLRLTARNQKTKGGDLLRAAHLAGDLISLKSPSLAITFRA